MLIISVWTRLKFLSSGKWLNYYCGLSVKYVGWLLVVLGFTATLTAKRHIMAVDDAHVFTPVLTQLFFPKPTTTFVTCFCEAKMSERKFASTGDRTNKHQVMSLTRSQLSHPGGAVKYVHVYIWHKYENQSTEILMKYSELR